MSEKSALERKYRPLIIILSIVIPIVVAALFSVRIEGYNTQFLPPIYATINGITAILLVIAVWAIKNGKRKLHERLMKLCIACSLVFLLLYIIYHSTSESTAFLGEGMIRTVYFTLLISHILLSIAIIPLVMITYVRAWAERFDKHRRIARITFPIWLYVAVSGVLVYLMISPYYV